MWIFFSELLKWTISKGVVIFVNVRIFLAKPGRKILKITDNGGFFCSDNTKRMEFVTDFKNDGKNL
jgi:hypothetical protein